MFHLISVYSDFVWPLNYTLLFLVSIGMLIGMIRMHLWFISQADGRYTILGYTTTDSPSFAHMKLGILCCESKYRRYWSPSRHGIHNLYRMSDEVTINLRWMIGRSPFFALMPLVTMYDTTINSGWGTDTEDWIYISISIAKMQIVDLQIVCDCGCTMLHSGWEVWNADSLHRSVSKNAIYIAWHVYLQLFDRARNK